MNTNCIGLVISIIYILTILLAALYINKKTKIQDEIVRKIIHILTTLWWIILIIYFDNVLYAISGPLVFIFLNSFLIFYPNIGKLIGCPNRKRNLGLVYYPFSILVLILWTYLGKVEIYAATMGVFSMGFGDGFAAIFGKLLGKRKIPLPTGGKTYLGSFVMLAVCFISNFFILSIMVDTTITIIILYSIYLAVAAALLEVITPLGFDNISVPLIITLLAGGLI